MATESLSIRVESASCTIDGAAAIVMELVESSDPRVSRIAHAVGDLLERVSADLDQVAVEVQQLTEKEL